MPLAILILPVGEPAAVDAISFSGHSHSADGRVLDWEARERSVASAGRPSSSRRFVRGEETT